MTSTRRAPRRGASRGFDTIILKDLRCLEEGNIGNLHNFFKLGSKANQCDDDDRLFCHETLDDLDDFWAKPVKPKRAKKSALAKGISPPPLFSCVSPPSPSSWIVTAPPNTPTDQTFSQLIESTSSPLKPILSLAEPTPNVPKTAASQPDQTIQNQPEFFLNQPESTLNQPDPISVQAGNLVSNPYITYLVHSLERRPRDLTRSHSASNPGSGTIMASLLQPEEPEDNLVPVNPDDVLVIPDAGRHGMTDLTLYSRQGDDEQQVPLETEHILADHNELFADDGFFTPPSQPSSCLLDQVVPDIQLEE